jgi:exopolysaccharide biosynthesis polyprenyl glycosylphosphotransferase
MTDTMHDTTLDWAGDSPPAPAPIDSSTFLKRNRLKLMLLGGDAMAVVIATLASLFAFGYSYKGVLWLGIVVVAAAAGAMWALRSQGLFLARVSAVRVVEITRLTRATGIFAGLMLLADRVLHTQVRVVVIATAAAAALVLLVISRSGFRSWLALARRRNEFCRRVVVLGTDEEAVRLIELFRTHPELGIRVAGIIGDRRQAENRRLSDLWLGDVHRAEELIEWAGASGVVVLPSGVSSSRLNELIRNLHGKNVHIHLATGISGIDSRRLRSLPLAHEPLLYVEAVSLGKLQHVAKRVFDVAVASFAVLIVSPFMIIAALAVKLNDGGPVFFKQERVGRGGKTFGVLKFRTMMVDAERQLARLTAANERRGPLFKMVDDPRVTRVGKFLRESSIDELPQLFNVIRGEMSLVGPRPALPAEVAKFPAALRAREQVMPGITGLWQVEARDNPSFDAYSRLDLFYVENWSITLDMMIILGTLEQLVVRVVSMIRRPKPQAVVVDLPVTSA